MTPRTTGRQRALGIRLDYFKSPGPWERRKWLATVVVVICAGAWWTVSALVGHQNAALHSPGAVAAVHHTWQSQCSACHVDFHPINADSVAARLAHGTPEADEKCQTCHRPAEHHALASAGDAASCSTCHQEHRGEQASLVRTDDRQCTRCHDDIERHTVGAPSLWTDARHVSRFDAEHHPEFASLKREPGHLKFSHYRHLTPGLASHPGGDKQPMTLRQIVDPAQRERYRRPGQGDEALVQLDCGSCHQLDSAGFAAPRALRITVAMLPARAAGNLMLPITYANQCQACHPLYKSPGIVHHRQTPEQLRQALEGEFSREALVGDPELPRTVLSPEPLPGARPSGSETVRQAIARNVATAERELSQQYCGKCHDFVAPGPGLQPVVAVNVAPIRLQHATFDHRAHRAVDCRECHAAAYPEAANASHAGDDVLVPGRDVCLKCHGPAAQNDGVVTGGARFDCVECHRYHHRAAPLLGNGVQAESPIRKLSQEEFEAGEPKEQ